MTRIHVIIHCERKFLQCTWVFFKFKFTIDIYHLHLGLLLRNTKGKLKLTSSTIEG